MTSSFIREQQRYTRDDLKSKLLPDSATCSDGDIARIIKKLKCYGILKTVKYSDEQLNMSDLVEEDTKIVDEDDFREKSFYIFTFVGIIIVEGVILKCYPKYIHNENNLTDKLKQVIHVLREYNSKRQIINMYCADGSDTAFNRLAVIVTLLNDYFENGIYTDTKNIIEINGMGEIDWDRTINGTFPIIKNNRPYYVDLRTKGRINDNDGFFKRLHEIVLTKCSEELKKADLLELLDVEGIFLTNEGFDDLGGEDYVLHRLSKELDIQFNTRKQIVLKALEALILNHGTLGNDDSISMYGSNSFNLVWEDVCTEVLDDKLHTQIQHIGINDVKIPGKAPYSLTSELISIIEKPEWHGKTNAGEEFIKEADRSLTPDLISIHQHGDRYYFIIFDAKYYDIQLEKDKDLKRQPGVADITKQYLYQLAYKEFVEANNVKVVNCFLMPTEEECNNGVINKGYVKMGMLEKLGLKYIHIRQLSAEAMYKHYLTKQKFDIALLKLHETSYG